MPSRKFLTRFGALLCAAMVLSVAAETRAQTKLYNINLPPIPSNSPVAPPSSRPMPMSAQPVFMPPLQQTFQPMVAVSQPPMMYATAANDFPQPVVVQGNAPMGAASAEPDNLPPPAMIGSTIPPVANSRSPSPPPGDINLAMPPPDMTLATRSGIDAGLQISGYRYDQPSPSTTISGARYGGTLAATAALGQGFFVGVDGRYSLGWLDYSGTGDLSDRRDTLWETRGVMGIDFIYEYFSVSPYAGFGFRSVTDDLQGVTDTSTRLPQKQDNLYYVPLGVHPRIPIDALSRFASTFEYDFIVHGEETTHLNDEGTGDPTIRNEQSGGYGFRVELMYETPWWSIGPFGNYWSVSSSNATVFHSPSSTCGSATCSFTQPNNHTIEGGVQFKVHFL